MMRNLERTRVVGVRKSQRRGWGDPRDERAFVQEAPASRAPSQPRHFPSDLPGHPAPAPVFQGRRRPLRGTFSVEEEPQVRV